MPDAHGSHDGLDSTDELRVLRAAVEDHGGNGADVADLRTPLRRFCEYARREHMPPEQVLIRVKRALDGLPVADGDGRTNDSIRQQIIALAIESYYFGDGDKPSGT